MLLFSHSFMSNSFQLHYCSISGFPDLHYLPEFAQTYVHLVDDAIQQSNPLSPPLLFLPSIFLSFMFFSNESALCIRWPKYWRSFNSPSKDYSGLIVFSIDWFALLAVQGTHKRKKYMLTVFSYSLFK